MKELGGLISYRKGKQGFYTWLNWGYIRIQYLCSIKAILNYTVNTDVNKYMHIQALSL